MSRNTDFIKNYKAQEEAAKAAKAATTVAEEPTENANNGHVHNANNEHEQNENNEHEEITNNEQEQTDPTEVALEEANSALEQLLNPAKFNDKKEPPKEMKGIYFEGVVLANLINNAKKYKKGFLSAFVNEAVKKELIAQGIYNPNAKIKPKKG